MFSLSRAFVLNNCLRKISNLPAFRFSTSNIQSASITDTEKVALSPEPVLINPLDVPDYFGVHQIVSLHQLFNSRAHLGHKEGTLNEFMTPYLYGSRLGICIIDLNQTVARLKDALNFTAHIAFRGGVILFVSNHKETGQYVENTAKECGEYAHCRHYQTFTLTKARGFFGKVMRLPDLCIFLSTFNNVFLEHDGIRDCAKMFIPTIAICDTNSDPRLVTYPVPGNDDTPSSVHLYCDLFKQAILKGKTKREELTSQLNENQQDNLFRDSDR